MKCRLVDLSSGKYDVLHKIPPSLLPSSNKILLWADFLIQFVWHRDRNISGICGCRRLYCVLFKVEMLPFRAKNSIFTVEQCTIKVADDRFTGKVEKRGLSFGNHEKGHFPALWRRWSPKSFYFSGSINNQPALLVSCFFFYYANKLFDYKVIHFPFLVPYWY